MPRRNVLPVRWRFVTIYVRGLPCGYHRDVSGVRDVLRQRLLRYFQLNPLP
jgi:hypothetical protein